MPFALPVDGGVVRGSLDLLVREGESATVLDYKTGKGPSDNEAYRSQAEIYALVLLRSGCNHVEVRFLRVEEECREVTFRFSAGDAADIERRVVDAFAAMAAGHYDRLAHFDAAVCPDCPVSGNLCPVAHPGLRPAPEPRDPEAATA